MHSGDMEGRLQLWAGLFAAVATLFSLCCGQECAVAGGLPACCWGGAGWRLGAMTGLLAGLSVVAAGAIPVLTLR
jgi:hypothetical protein